MDKNQTPPKKLTLKRTKIVSLTKAQMMSIKGGGTGMPTKRPTQSGVDCTGRYGV